MASTPQTHINRGTDQRNRTRTRHSKENALDALEFELLLEGATRLDHQDDVLQAQFAINVLGRLGLRVSELVHMTGDWIDERQRMIHIPGYEPCTMGRNDSICGTCRQHAEQRVAHNPEMDLDEALSMAWSAKTENAARSVPYDFDPRVEIAVERFLERYPDGWPLSGSSVTRRLEWAQDRSEGLEDANVHPHGLRATAASYHAAQGIDAISLQAIFGWAQLSTARVYIATSPERAAAVLRDVHQR